MIYCDTAIEENQDPNNRGKNQHLSVQAQPGKIQADLVPKIFPGKHKSDS